MILVQPFHPDDMLAIDVQPAQAAENDRVGLYELGRMQAMRGQSYTARCAATGRILIVGGYVENHAGYASLWAVLALRKGQAMQTITRRIAALIAGLPHARVDATVHAGFDAGRRWMRLIGLVHEVTLAGAMSDGGDAMIFRRVG